jgi:cation diffusion facilitator family transporter
MNIARSTFAGPDRTAPAPATAAASPARDELESRAERTTRSILITIGSNVAIAIAKGVAAFVTGSGAMLAEALHSLSDTGNGLLLLWGQREAKKPASPEHPLGHGRATYFWSFVVGLLLFTSSGVAAIYEGIHRLESGDPIVSPWIAIGILLFALVAEGAAQFVTVRSIKRRRGDLTLWQWLRHTRHSELIVTFAEDTAALIGLAIALAAVVVTMLTGDVVYDAAGSIAIGVLLIVVAIALCIEIKSLLIGESASPKVRQAIVEFLEAREPVVKVAHLISSQHGEELMLGIKAEMDPRLDARGLIEAINACEAELRTAFPQVVWIFFEPVRERARAGPGLADPLK